MSSKRTSRITNADHAAIADLAERAKRAEIADQAVKLIEQRRGDFITRKSGEEVRIADSNGVKKWFHDLLSPQTVIMLAIFVAAFIGSWLTMSTRIAETNVEIRVLREQMKEQDAKQRDDLKNAIADRNERLNEERQDRNRGDERTWTDINQLRQAMMDHIGNPIAHRGAK